MPTGKSAQSGFTYLFVLMLIALIGMGLAAAGTLWRTDAQRAREAELLFMGDQYRQAIRSFYQQPNQPPRLPQSLDELHPPWQYNRCARIRSGKPAELMAQLKMFGL